MKNLKQMSLFGEEETKIETNLVSIPKTPKALSKEQNNFNKLTKSIQNLEKEIEDKEITLQNILKYFSKNIPVEEEKSNRQRIAAAFLLEKVLLKSKLTKHTEKETKELIYTLLFEAFQSIEPNKEEEELYDRYSETSFQEEKKEQLNDLIGDFASMIKDKFNFDLDLEDVDIKNIEDMARLQAKIQEKISQNKNAEDLDSKTKKKTKKQIEKELLEKEKLEAQSKSLKSVYLSLVKILHPDKESDSVQKMEKDELMKQVTVAYKEKDLSTLLKLELAWVNKTEDNLAEISDEKLKIYCAILKDREKELKQEKFEMVLHPKFSNIYEFLNLTEQQAISKINRLKKNFQNLTKQFKANIETIEKIKNKKNLSKFISDFYSEIVSSQFDSFMMDDLEDFLKNYH
jgi:hypothetical protein